MFCVWSVLLEFVFDVGGVFDVVIFSLFVLLVVSFGRLVLSIDCVSLVCVSSCMEGGVVVSVSASSVVVVDVVSVEVVVAAAVLVVAIEGVWDGCCWCWSWDSAGGMWY